MATEPHDEDYELHIRAVKVPRGQHLPDSKDTEGAARDLLFEDGTNKLRGPAESFPIDEDELRERLGVRPDDGDEPSTNEDRLSPGQQAVADVILHIVDEVLEQIDWDAVFERVWPAVRRAPSRIASFFGFKKRDAVPPATIDRSTPKVVMSSEEYRRFVLEAMAAEAFASRRRSLLANAVVDDGLITPELMNSTRLLLEARVSELSETELAAVLAFLGSAQGIRGAVAFPSALPLK